MEIIKTVSLQENITEENFNLKTFKKLKTNYSKKEFLKTSIQKNTESTSSEKGAKYKHIQYFLKIPEGFITEVFKTQKF